MSVADARVGPFVNGILAPAMMLLAMASPAADNELSGIAAISARDGQTCALTSTGGVKCWGVFLGAAHLAPLDMPGLQSGVKAISVGGSGALCALMDNADVQCTGGNVANYISHDSIQVAAVSAGGAHACTAS
jgi:hypothetical protein